jgi:DNA polymerase elongation subunit (family B)
LREEAEKNRVKEYKKNFFDRCFFVAKKRVTMIQLSRDSIELRAIFETTKISFRRGSVWQKCVEIFDLIIV